MSPALEDLDALDRVQRQAAPHRRAGRGRAIAHAVDQQDGVARFGAADEDVAALATAAVGGHLHARGAHQHFGQRLASHLFDVGALDDGDVAHQAIHPRGRAAGGDDGIGERGNGTLRKGGRSGRQAQQESGLAPRRDTGFHGRNKGREPSPPSPTVHGRHGGAACAVPPPRWPVSGLAERPPSPSRCRTPREVVCTSGGVMEAEHPAAVGRRPSRLLTVAGAAQVRFAAMSGSPSCFPLNCGA
jgi:hypothetical protein